MIKVWKSSFIIMASVLVLMACSAELSGEFEVVEKDTSSQKENKPTLHAELIEEDNKVFLHIETDLEVSKEKYGGAKQAGQGHIHVYVNDGEKQGVTEFPYEITDLKKGLNNVKVSLHNNDHTPYGVSKKLEIEINK